MRVLLRNVITGKYYKGEGQWTADAPEAYDFRSGAHAIKTWAGSAETCLEMVFSFGDSKYDLTLALRQSAEEQSVKREPGTFRSAPSPVQQSRQRTSTSGSRKPKARA